MLRIQRDSHCRIDIGKHASIGNVQLVKFVNEGGNLLVATSTEPSSPVRDLAAEFDIELGDDEIDMQQIDDVSSRIIGDDIDVPVLFTGVDLSLGQSPMLNRILSTSKADLVAAMQGRNSARATFVGSRDMFSDR